MVVKRKSKATKVPVMRKINYEEDDDVLFEARNIVALRSDDQHEQFFVAELLDDITESMFDNPTTTINLIYYDKQQDNLYQVGNYDEAPVRAIMCEIDLVRSGTDKYEIPAHYLQRIEKVLKSVETGESIPDEVMQPVKKRKSSPTQESTISPKNKTKNNAGKQKRQVPTKLNKCTGLQKCLAHIDGNVEDYEMSGNHGFREKVHDILSSSKEIIRAVLTKNYELLENLTNPDSPYIQDIYALHTVRSVGVPKCALEYAIENNDLKAIGLLMATKDKEYKFGARPPCALSSLSTGSHTSSYSDYGRRAINASRGGKEGVNALLKDQEKYKISPFHASNKGISHVIWTKSYDIVALFFPGDSWVRTAETIMPDVFRCGNFELAEKMVAILIARNGWGYNYLHLQVLRDAPLERFRRASALKKANGSGISPLHLAALSIYPANLQQLMGELKGSDLDDFCDKNKWHAVHYAAVSPSSASMQLMLDENIDLRVKTDKKETALFLACKTGRVQTVKLLLEHISNIGDASTYLEFSGPDGYRPIHIAAKNGFADIIELLLQSQANINATTSTTDGKESALALAAECGHLDCVSMLLKHRSKVDITDKVRRTPLMYAVMNGHTSVARALINADADALVDFSSNNDLYVNRNAADSSLNTVMHYAASYGWLSCVQLLQSIKAETWSSNDWGYTPMACAALKSQYDVSHYLIENSDQQKIDFRDANGATMLYLQCHHAVSIDEINFLLSKS
ncbi:hypothetical protein THRCLA_10554 [Thraustotheca clavata]|uniref:Uncharacterized protein n=1 Tax=Thraustotheca clavata TaxID=74557 RepID=A0A1V9YKV5_9STRA|nr:hypothetical protein THRCLA_10554 [Thraustotheca clavata]